MAKNEKLFELENVWKTYHAKGVDTHALRGVDLEIEKGEYIALLGPSGSGKSTLMHIIGCLDTPTKGTVLLDGEKISELDQYELSMVRRNKIGFVFQAYNLIPGFTAMENVSVPMRFKGVPKSRAVQEANKLLKMVGLEKRSTHKPNELSGGEQQRVAIARSLSNDPEVILADEPTGNLDTRTGNEIVKLIHDLHKKSKKTIMVVTHDASLAKKANRQVFIRDGKIVKKLKEVEI